MKEKVYYPQQLSEVERMRLKIRNEAREAKEFERRYRMDLQLELCEMGLSGVSYKNYEDVMRRRRSQGL